VTEEIVKTILEKESKMRCGIDFHLGYSPERINPGDEAHTLDKITKIVAGMDKLFSFAKTFTKLLTLFLLRKNKYFFGKAFFKPFRKAFTKLLRKVLSKKFHIIASLK